jgi:hypothetical protein
VIFELYLMPLIISAAINLENEFKGLYNWGERLSFMCAYVVKVGMIGLLVGVIVYVKKRGVVKAEKKMGTWIGETEWWGHPVGKFGMRMGQALVISRDREGLWLLFNLVLGL